MNPTEPKKPSGTGEAPSDARQAAEAAIRARWDAGDLDGAATEVIRIYGPELYGLLLSLHPRGGEADDLFSIVCEHLWRGLAGFRWHCSIRTWAYVVARNTSRTHGEVEGRRARREVDLAACSAVDRMAVAVRTETASYLRTEKRSEIEKLRDELPVADRTLLILRLDRGLAWNDLARVFLDDPGAEDEVIRREAARLRKRFQLVRERLVALGRARGLLRDGDG
ncbi:RNA polymerase sigma24 factor [Sorangium cellulosum]|uniref:RNA polymerase sigma24 factor n=1 Tax=Sorangium cellulosum TaxID=56 RepID=A0A2L0EIF2_SORCE|nr:sigma-70 family RNA polymerase sigma factor [Sorangium cellulosum]AUX39070.1 RNA polymerase sigma24 factor [Sorangium cellulosum]